MNRITQRVQALEKGNEDGANIGELLDLLGDPRLITVKVQASLLKALDAMPDD